MEDQEQLSAETLPEGPKKAIDVREMSPQGRYVKLDERLGSGAYKDVWRAYDTNEGIEVAWNVVKLSRIPPGERKRIKTEVKLLRDIEHKNVIKYYNSWVDREKEQIVFITEIMSSGSIKDYLRKNPMIRWNAVKRWCRQILRALEFLHENQIIHRDIKCDNIFINGATGDLRIGDLGLSTRISEERAGLAAAVALDSTGAGLKTEVRQITTGAMTCLGTPEFMAPELYDENYNEKVDIYAFGMTLLEMITGLTPYHHCTSAPQIYKKVLRGELPMELQQVEVSCPAAYSFIYKCLQKKDERPSAKELLASPFLLPNEAEDYKEVRIWQTHAIVEDAEEEDDDGETVSSGNTLVTAATAGSNNMSVGPVDQTLSHGGGGDGGGGEGGGPRQAKNPLLEPHSSQYLMSLDSKDSDVGVEEVSRTGGCQLRGGMILVGHRDGITLANTPCITLRNSVITSSVEAQHERKSRAFQLDCNNDAVDRQKPRLEAQSAAKVAAAAGADIVSQNGKSDAVGLQPSRSSGSQPLGRQGLSFIRFKRKTGSGVLDDAGSGLHTFGSGAHVSSGEQDVERRTLAADFHVSPFTSGSSANADDMRQHNSLVEAFEIDGLAQICHNEPEVTKDVTRSAVSTGTNAAIVDVTNGENFNTIVFHLRVPMRESGIIATEPDVLVEFEYSLDRDEVTNVVQEMRDCEELSSLAIDTDYISSLLQPMVTIAMRIALLLPHIPRASLAEDCSTTPSMGLAETLIHQVLEANPPDSSAGWVLRHLRAGWQAKQREKAEKDKEERERTERERKGKELQEWKEQQERERELDEDEEYRAISSRHIEAIAKCVLGLFFSIA